MRVHLFVASDPAKLDNAFASGADALWLDGSLTASALQDARRRAATLKLYVCPGSLDGALDEDLDAAMNAAPDGIVLPVRNGADVQQLGMKLAVREAEFGLADGATRIIALIAAPRAVFQMGSFGGASPRLAALAFDAQGFATSLGITDLSAPPLGIALDLTLLAAKAAGVAAILVAAAANSPEAYKAAKRDGFDAILVRDAADIAAIHGL